MRIDYFVDSQKIGKNNLTNLSQIEINTLGCGGTAIPSKLIDLYK